MFNAGADPAVANNDGGPPLSNAVLSQSANLVRWVVI